MGRKTTDTYHGDHRDESTLFPDERATQVPEGSGTEQARATRSRPICARCKKRIVGPRLVIGGLGTCNACTSSSIPRHRPGATRLDVEARLLVAGQLSRAAAGPLTVVLGLLQDARARIMRALDAVIDGDTALAEQILDDLLTDLERTPGWPVR